MLLALLFILLTVPTQYSDASSCHTPSGESMCKFETCKKNVKCKGNSKMSPCNCCTVCLLKENEECDVSPRGGFDVINGECDHEAPVCGKKKNGNKTICMTVRTALINDVREVIPKVLRLCKKSKDDEGYQKKIFMCFLTSEGPEYFCRKKDKLTYHVEEDCCIHSNGCNPDKNLYDKINKASPYTRINRKVRSVQNSGLALMDKVKKLMKR